MTMRAERDPVDMALLDRFQRDLPLISRPYAEIGARLGLSEEDVLDRLRRLVEQGAVSRVGGACRPNAAGASTLAAVAAPEWRIEEAAEIIGAEPGVNHSYLREHEMNLWFVATGPDRAHVDATLARIEKRTGLEVLDAPLIRPFNLDLGFALDGSGRRAPPGPDRLAAPAALDAQDREILQAMTSGLGLVARPFAALGDRLGLTEEETIARIRALAAERVLTRIGVIVRHRALGWRSNAMVVWKAPEEMIDVAGPALAAAPGVTLCYRRRPDPRRWPYTLYCMIHARSRPEAMEILDVAARQAGLEDIAHEVLFSLRCFKQTGALIAPPKGEAA